MGGWIRLIFKEMQGASNFARSWNQTQDQRFAVKYGTTWPRSLPVLSPRYNAQANAGSALAYCKAAVLSLLQ